MSRRFHEDELLTSYEVLLDDQSVERAHALAVATKTPVNELLSALLADLLVDDEATNVTVANEVKSVLKGAANRLN